MATYIAFLSAEDQDDTMPESVNIDAPDRETARARFADTMRTAGCSADLSDTSEEVTVTGADGKEYVYFGFDE